MTRPVARLLTAATLLTLLPACGAHSLGSVATTRGLGATSAQSAPGQL